MGQGGSAALNGFFRARIAILALTVLLALGAAAGCLRAHPPNGQMIGPLIAAAILAVLSLVQLRHAALVALALAAPLPGLLGAMLLLPTDGDTLSLWLAYLPAFFLAGFFVAETATRAAEGEASETAARNTMTRLAPAALCALAAACAPALFLAPGAMFAAMLAGACALIVVPLGASLLSFGEDFAARANRLRERRERSLAHLAQATQPRWGWSLSGIAIVLAALGFFGAAPLANRVSLTWLAAIFVSIAAVFLATRDWRRSLAALLAFVPALFLALWVFARVPPDAAAWRHLLQALGIGFIPVVLISARAARYARDGEDVAVASMRALERDGAALLFAAAACALSLVPFHRLQEIPAALGIFLAAPSALVFAPAFGAALENLFPRRAVIAARYRVG
jgi:hypothetical protein